MIKNSNGNNFLIQFLNLSRRMNINEHFCKSLTKNKRKSKNFINEFNKVIMIAK